MVARKVLTRAEAHARTRDELIDAAEQLFLVNGYRTTSIAAVAAEAGRTVGAIYSNFDSKEDLCLEVLKRWVSAEVASLAADLATSSGDDVDARVAVLTAWWAGVSANSNLVILVAEYMLSILRDFARRAEMVSTCKTVIEVLSELLATFLPEGLTTSDDAAMEAAQALIFTGVGLSAGQAAGVIGSDDSVTIFTSTLRLILGDLIASVTPA
ncbi:TetR/AcrR family transcriptional regulator [Rhodococcus sp. G-MC3]|uniref:TetR/AcrR family transcriptional regulator n=1 Tax=Rhodococcus sp. G-MC3 TaxID=3046209 RepID=UPI0024BBBA54|nr:TetR/AcrR family transcriptional regulator [Rhodococcus sp. G-MC3]MDJ0392637.1 TetR/AcrR family transcriptional regulator [Rhodococcus sp. G-MC3]